MTAPACTTRNNLRTAVSNEEARAWERIREACAIGEKPWQTAIRQAAEAGSDRRAGQGGYRGDASDG